MTDHEKPTDTHEETTQNRQQALKGCLFALGMCFLVGLGVCAVMLINFDVKQLT